MNYKFNEEGKIKREYLSNYIFVDGRYERMSKLGTHPFNNNILWEDINHFEEEINDYENNFNKIIMNKKIENNGKIHINNNNCFCSFCIIKDKLNKIGLKNFEIIKEDKHYIIINNKKIELSKYFDSFY